MSEQSGLTWGTMGMVIERLPATNYRIWALRITNCLICEGLWDLTTGTESDIVAPLGEDTDYEMQHEKYLAQRKRIQNAIVILHLGMTDVIAFHYCGTLWESPGKIWEDVRRSYMTETRYYANYLQMELYECQCHTRSAPSIFLPLKILTAFGLHKPPGLVFISSRYTYFGFSLGLHLQVKYIFHLC